MFDFIRRLVSPEVTRAPAPRRPARPAAKPKPARMRPTGPLPTPEVSEVDWSEWEHSVLDSEMQGLSGPYGSARWNRHSQFQDTQPSGLQDFDAFASVSKNDP